LISYFSSPPGWDLSAARKFFIIHYFWKIGLTKHQIDLQIKVFNCCIPQAQLKLYLSKDITRHNASIFHVSPGMYRNILYYCSVGRIKLKLIIHRLTSDFYGVFYWVKEIIDKQNSNTKNNKKWKMKKSRSKFLKIVDEKHDINFHWPNVNKRFVYILNSVLQL
jgi:hypothetical protein